MSIDSFKRLACDFVNAAEQGNPNVFLGRRIKPAYWGLSVTDRLIIHALIDREDYLRNPPKQFKGCTREETLQTLETIYQQLMEINHQGILVNMNAQKIDDPVAFGRIEIFRCAAVYIAIDLGYAILEKPKPPNPSPYRPV